MDEKMNDHIVPERDPVRTEQVNTARKSKVVEQVEKVDNSDGPGDAKVKQVNVLSVALTDALARDNLSPWCPSMLKLYLILILVTLSRCP